MPIGDSDCNSYETEFDYVTGRPIQPEETATTDAAEGRPAKPKVTWGDVGEQFVKDAQAIPSKLYHGLIDAATSGPKLMERVAKGELDPLSDEGIKAAHEVAMNFGITGLATAPMKPGLGIFGGRMSKSAVSQAEKMEAEGFSQGTIKDITGLERGADAKWRLELNDYFAKIDIGKTTEVPHNRLPEFLKEDLSGKISVGKLGQVLDHPELFKRYPELKDVPIVFADTVKIDGKGSYGGYYDPSAELIAVKRDMSKEYQRETLLHEIQHWVQQKEGFASRSFEEFPNEVKDRVKRSYLKERLSEKEQKALKTLDERRADLPVDVLERANERARKYIEAADFAGYLTTATEVEARNVGLRSNLRPSETRQLLARETEDIPRSQQLVSP